MTGRGRSAVSAASRPRKPAFAVWVWTMMRAEAARDRDDPRQRSGVAVRAAATGPRLGMNSVLAPSRSAR